MKVTVAVLALAVVALADSYNSYKPGYYKEFNYAPAYYNFAYQVKDDYPKSYNGYSYGPLDFGHNENRNGDNTKGSYNVLLPDGRRQIVNYYVDGYSGYVADVKYEGYANPYDYKAYKSTYQPAYPSTYAAAY